MSECSKVGFILSDNFVDAMEQFCTVPKLDAFCVYQDFGACVQAETTVTADCPKLYGESAVADVKKVDCQNAGFIVVDSYDDPAVEARCALDGVSFFCAKADVSVDPEEIVKDKKCFYSTGTSVEGSIKPRAWCDGMDYIVRDNRFFVLTK